MRTAALFAGYWANEEATRAAMTPDGWYRTGDYGYISEQRLFLSSRRTDLIIRGGENIYPTEVENRLIEHPAVADVAVIGVADPELGQAVKAIIVPTADGSITADEVRYWCASHLAQFKVPAHVEFRSSLPYTASGKLRRADLERQAHPPITQPLGQHRQGRQTTGE